METKPSAKILAKSIIEKYCQKMSANQLINYAESISKEMRLEAYARLIRENQK